MSRWVLWKNSVEQAIELTIETSLRTYPRNLRTAKSMISNRKFAAQGQAFPRHRPEGSPASAPSMAQNNKQSALNLLEKMTNSAKRQEEDQRVRHGAGDESDRGTVPQATGRGDGEARQVRRTDLSPRLHQKGEKPQMTPGTPREQREVLERDLVRETASSHGRDGEPPRVNRDGGTAQSGDDRDIRADSLRRRAAQQPSPRRR